MSSFSATLENKCILLEGQSHKIKWNKWKYVLTTAEHSFTETKSQMNLVPLISHSGLKTGMEIIAVYSNVCLLKK